jgi:hypothetical protein
MRQEQHEHHHEVSVLIRADPWRSLVAALQYALQSPLQASALATRFI